MAGHVFISYSWRDKARVHEYAKTLSDRGQHIFLDEKGARPGIDLTASLYRALANASAVVVFVGTEGLGNIQKEEVTVAMYRRTVEGITVIPVLLGGVSLPGSLSPLLAVRASFGSPMEVVTEIEHALTESLDLAGVRPESTEGVTSTGPKVSSTKRPVVEVQLQNPKEMLSRLYQDFLESPPAFVLGGRYPEKEAGLPPSRSQFTRRMLIELGVVDSDYEELLPCFERTGAFYAFTQTNNFGALENFVGKQIQAQSAIVPNVFTIAATTVKIWAERERAKDYDQHPVVIVTTNHDTLIERALIRAGCPFTRFVQRHDQIGAVVKTYGQNDIRGAGDLNEPDFKGLLRGNATELSAAEARKLQFCDKDEPGTFVVLVKYHGSYDVPLSCAIADPQLFRLAKHHCVPEDVTSTLKYTPMIVAGYRLVDGDLHHLWTTWLKEVAAQRARQRVFAQPPLEQDDSDAIQGRIEKEIRAGLLRNCHQLLHAVPIEIDPATFLAEVRDHTERVYKQ